MSPSSTIPIAAPRTIWRTTNNEQLRKRARKGTMTKSLKVFGDFITTWFGCLVVFYALNVIAWGGMLFLLLITRPPSMCSPEDGKKCNAINARRRIWIEIASQILTVLFCVTGWGLIPWRSRELWYLLRWRLTNNALALRRLAGYNRSWMRLPGSQHLSPDLGPNNVEFDAAGVSPDALPFPIWRIPEVPSSGIRATPTALWKLDLVVWMNFSNTLYQTALCGVMWALDRCDRQAWVTGLLVALACISNAIGGLVTVIEGKRIKKVEGATVTTEKTKVLERPGLTVVPQDLMMPVEKLNEKHEAGQTQVKGSEVMLAPQAESSDAIDESGRM